MIRFGIICPELSGHLNPTMALARVLQSRGHQITFYQRPLSKEKIINAGFNCAVFGEEEFPIEVMHQELETLAKISGLPALKFTIDLFRRRMQAAFEQIPLLAKANPIDALICDETNWEGATIAEMLGIPLITTACALCLRAEPAIPPFFTTWSYRNNLLGRIRNGLAYRLFKKMGRPLLETVNAQRTRAGLRPYDRGEDICSQLLFISQQPSAFDFPRLNPPAALKYVGPMVDASLRGDVPFPFERLNGKPLVYASLGTLQNHQKEIFQTIASACAPLDVQLVLSLGGGSKPESLGQLAGDPIAVEFAPQLELIRRSTLSITHAGLNTALESMAEGVPMVALPITNDQPGVAARIAFTGCGEVLSIKKLKVEKLRSTISKVLSDPTYRQNAKKMQQNIQQHRGAQGAADLIEAALIPTR